jgi:hypothetical protein
MDMERTLRAADRISIVCEHYALEDASSCPFLEIIHHAA